MGIGKLANYHLICGMVNYISADTIFPVNSPPIPNGVIGVLDNGQIHSVMTKEEAIAQQIPAICHYPGVIVPGFVNAHCHLELSHMYNQVEAGTGLIQFIKGILSKRHQPELVIEKAMKMADQEMYNNGIVAVGDIANQLDSKKVKLQSRLYYHTFVEVFGFNAPAEETIAKGLALKKEFEPLKTTIVPHAPYSVSQSLFHEIASITSTADVMSIHNQETTAENELFEFGTGQFDHLFNNLGIAKSVSHGSGINAIQYHLPQLPTTVNTLLVHNTFTNQSDLKFAKETHQKLYWCFCPNANLYIENALPDVQLFIREGVKITLGTDSLASNHQLSILAEMKALQDHLGIPFAESLVWATLNGAAFLGIDSKFGSISEGKNPGLLHLNLDATGKINEHTTINRLF
jgi:cytosine/adenosine deaminase-related metal-dependent hydrolase